MALQWNVTFSDSVTVWSTGSVIKPGATKQKMETQCEIKISQEMKFSKLFNNKF